MDFFPLLALLLILYLGWRRLRRVEAGSAELRARIAAVEALLLQRPGPGAQPSSAPETATDAPEPEPYRGRAEPEPAIADAPPVAQPVVARESLEQRLTSRWLVWVGGLALALGGVFLAKYSIERGLLGPGLRVLLGILAAFLMLLGGEYLVRAADPKFAAVRTSYVPSALTAAGIVTLFATLFAAHRLLDLISALPAFAALAAASALAVLLSPRHGPFMALLGLLGGLLVPLAIASDAPSTVGLFIYLAIVLAGNLAAARVRAWWWLGWCALGGISLWLILRVTLPFTDGETLAYGLFLFAVAALFLLFRNGLPGVAWLRPTGSPERVPTWQARAALHTVALFAFALVVAADASAPSVAVFLVLAAGSLALARAQPAFDELPFTTAVLGCLLLAAGTNDFMHDLAPAWRAQFALDTNSFRTVAGALTALFGAGAFALLWGALRPGRFAAVSAAVPVAVLAAAYWRFAGLEPDWRWAGAAIGLAAVQLAAAERLAPWRPISAAVKGALGAYAAGVMASVALAGAMILREAWLTVMLSALLPCIAWLYARLDVGGLRWTALAVAVVVLMRLVANPYVLDYTLTGPLFGWVLYGYGLPALAFVVALRLFRAGRDDVLTGTLEAGAIAFTVLLTTFSIRLAATGDLESASWEFDERATQSVNWLAIGVGLFANGIRRGRPVQAWAGRILLSLTTLHTVTMLLLLNPVLTNESVGRWPILNLLVVGYAAPALLYALLWRDLARTSRRKLAFTVAGLSLLFGFFYVTLEVRHAFRGEFLDAGETSDAEWYAYSAAWLALAAVLIAAGIRAGAAGLRHAGLVLTLIAVLKIFLFDMSDLDGLYRAASFLGLGAALVGIGFLYRRYLATPNAAAT